MINNFSKVQIMKSLFVFLFVLLGFSADAQWMLINKDGGTPDSTAALEIQDTTRGFLPPRLTTVQMNAMNSPATGLMIYNTDSNKYFYFDSSNWESLDGISNNSDTLDENVFSARISNTSGTASITSQNQNFISSVNRFSLGQVEVNFKSGFFSVAPSVLAALETQVDFTISISSITAAKCTVKILDVYSTGAGSFADASFSLLVHRQGSDYRYNTSGASASVLANSGDNLGNHSATQNLILDSNFISNDGDTEGISVSNGGNVTITPATTGAGQNGLDVKGDIITSGNGTGLKLTNGNIKILGNLSGNGDMQFYTAGTSRMSISSGGSVGIGTSSPSADLEIVDATGALTLKLENASNSDEDVRLIFSEDGNSRYSIGYDDGLDALIWSGAAWTGNRRMALSSTGDFGIGVVSPASKLHVDGTTTIEQSDASTTGLQIRRNSDNSTIMDVSTGASKNGNLSLYNSSGVEKIRLSSGSKSTYFNSSSNLGIGTDSPTNDLHIHSSNSATKMQITNSVSGVTAGDGFQLSADATNALIQNYESGDIEFNTNSADRMIIKSDGDVGIGIGAPAARLHVKGTTSDIAKFENDVGHAYQTIESKTGSKSYTFYSESGSTWGSIGSDGSDNSFRIYYGGVAGNPILAAQSATLVGVGTTNPKAQFHVSGGDMLLDNTKELQGELASGTASNLIKLNGSDHVQIGSTSNKDIRMNSGSANNAMTIADGGKVGIGTITPNWDLQVHNASATTSFAQFTNSATGSAATDGLEIGQSGAQAFIRNQENSNLKFGTNNTIQMTITGAGDVGIGTTSPTYKFDVEDDATAYVASFVNDNATTGDGIRIALGMASPLATNGFIRFDNNSGTLKGSVAGNGTGVTYNTTSDRRLKFNINDYQNGLELISEINPRLYQWKENPDKIEIGFIAQELQRVYPQAVSGDSTVAVEVTPMLVDYSKLTPVLTAAIKELHELVKTQQIQIEKLQSENKGLKVELGELEELKKDQKELQEQLIIIQKILNEGSSENTKR